jgi:hypothetical protein
MNHELQKVSPGSAFQSGNAKSPNREIPFPALAIKTDSPASFHR